MAIARVVLLVTEQATEEAIADHINLIEHIHTTTDISVVKVDASSDITAEANAETRVYAAPPVYDLLTEPSDQANWGRYWRATGPRKRADGTRFTPIFGYAGGAPGRRSLEQAIDNTPPVTRVI